MRLISHEKIAPRKVLRMRTDKVVSLIVHGQGNCSLDHADAGPQLLCAIGREMNLSREMVRVIEARGLMKAKRRLDQAKRRLTRSADILDSAAASVT